MRRGFTPDDRKLLLRALLPKCSDDRFTTLAVDFDRAHNELVEWFRARVVEYGDIYLESDIGKAWAVKFGKAKYVCCYTSARLTAANEICLR